MSFTIYHNPRCSNSRKVLEALREAGIEPTIIEYLKSPPSKAVLKGLIEAMGVPVRDVIRGKEPVYSELGLSDPALTDDQLLDAMVEEPILINRPIVVAPAGTRLCRPPEVVRELLEPVG